MNNILAVIFQEGAKMLTNLISVKSSPSEKANLESPEEAFKRIYPGRPQTQQALSAAPPPLQAPPQVSVVEKREVETACVPCSLGHFSTSAGLLNETIRFKKDGIASREVLDRIAKVLEEQNALERVDLTPEKLQATPSWERALAEEALVESRRLRHKLEGIQSMDELEPIAADTETFYKNLSATWFKQKLGTKGMSEEKFDKMREEAARRAIEAVDEEVLTSE